mgnify:CR=1 FL=1
MADQVPVVLLTGTPATDDHVDAVIEHPNVTVVPATTPEQNLAMRKAMAPVYDEVGSRVGKALIEEFVKESGGGPTK